MDSFHQEDTMTDLLLGLAFVAMIVTPAIAAAIQHSRRPHDQSDL